MTTELLERARAGDGDAFRTLTDAYRRELQVHCYRMLGSLQDAEDALQDTLLAAWQGLAGFEERASMRTWLYRVATNRCLNTLRSAARRPTARSSAPDVTVEANGRAEVVWLEPYPDALLEGAAAQPPGPEARYEATEAISLAFVTALQLLPARQRAVLVLRDVLGFHAAEVADMLGATVESVTSALKRARATLAQQLPGPADHQRPPAPNSAAESELVARLTRAYEDGDIDALIALLTADVVLSMPPLPLVYGGRDLARQFHAEVVFIGERSFRVVPTRANGQPAFGLYLRDADGASSHAIGLLVFALAGDRIAAITRFETQVLPSFGLPRSLPS